MGTREKVCGWEQLFLVLYKTWVKFFQHPHDCSQPPIILVSGGPICFLTSEDSRHLNGCTDTYASKIFRHIKYQLTYNYIVFEIQ